MKILTSLILALLLMTSCARKTTVKSVLVEEKEGPMVRHVPKLNPDEAILSLQYTDKNQQGHQFIFLKLEKAAMGYNAFLQKRDTLMVLNVPENIDFTKNEQYKIRVLQVRDDNQKFSFKELLQ